MGKKSNEVSIDDLFKQTRRIADTKPEVEEKKVEEDSSWMNHASY